MAEGAISALGAPVKFAVGLFGKLPTRIAAWHKTVFLWSDSLASKIVSQVFEHYYNFLPAFLADSLASWRVRYLAVTI